MQGMVEVRVYGTLRDYFAENCFSFFLQEPMSLKALLQEVLTPGSWEIIVDRLDKGQIIVVVAGIVRGNNVVLQPGDNVYLLPLISGG